MKNPFKQKASKKVGLVHWWYGNDLMRMGKQAVQSVHR